MVSTKLYHALGVAPAEELFSFSNDFFLPGSGVEDVELVIVNTGGCPLHPELFSGLLYIL